MASGMQGASTAERHQYEIAGVVAALDRDDADGTGHVIVGNRKDADGGGYAQST